MILVRAERDRVEIAACLAGELLALFEDQLNAVPYETLEMVDILIAVGGRADAGIDQTRGRHAFRVRHTDAARQQKCEREAYE